CPNGRDHLTFDPYYERMTRQFETSSDRIRTKLADRYAWCFCELCGNPTEYSATVAAPRVIKRLEGGNAKTVPLTKKIYSDAQQKAQKIIDHYHIANLKGKGSHESSRMLMRYCDISEMQGDYSTEGFKEQIENRILLAEWGRYGEIVWQTRLPSQVDGRKRPSKFYCERHNPRRGPESRRAYQRDRRFISEYQRLIEVIWSDGIRTCTLSTWDFGDHHRVRREAYRQLQALKAPTSTIETLLAKESMTQAEMARRLGVSRQAVSAALKRRSQKKQ
ncbi:winged helix-turn-helix transcriptional regulator, partial [Gluconobacter potus]|uniref:winged helix-turn-helix transcriptional regulator n=1 Tax=Gluconobacter potus TaxID=2724927 RepID=UPI000B0EB6C6